MNKKLWLIRGLPGSGKTTLGETLAKPLGAPLYSADQYFETVQEDGTIEYKFEMSKIGAAHAECQNKTRRAMSEESPNIFVANTFTRKSEMKEYYALAKEFGYRVFSVIVENRHDGKNIHNVPESTLKAMKDRFDVQL